MNPSTAPSSLALPPMTLPTAGRVLAAGVAGLAAWEVFARLVAPQIWGFGPEPTQLIEAALGIGGIGAQVLHILTGLLFFPAFYLLVARPLARAMVPALPWWALALGYGIALWVFAMYFMASLLAGMPPFLEFGAVTWASLFGHLGLGLGIGAAAHFTDR